MKKQYIKPPFLSTSFSENGKSAKRRFSNILTTKRRKAGAAVIAAALVGVLCAGALVACDRESEKEISNITGGNIPAGTPIEEIGWYKSMDEAVHAALIGERDSYSDEEFFAEGHILLGAKTAAAGGGSDVTAELYTVTSVGGYSFMNGMFVKDSGSGVIPAVIVLKCVDGEEYAPIEIKWPEDGSYYAESIKKMFPKEYHDKVLSADKYYDELTKQEHEQAKEYLKSIGRSAEIGSYADLGTELPDMNTEASNYLLSVKSGKDVGLPEEMYGFPLWKFPIYQGNKEYIQDGQRCIYETNWEGDKTGGSMHYTVYDEDGKVIMAYNFMVNGETVLLDETQRATDGDEFIVTNYCY